MTKPWILCAATAALFATSMAAQARALGPRPQPHPNNVLTPLVDNGGGQIAAASRIGRKGRAPAPPTPVTRGVQISGGALEDAIEKVAAMPWHDRLTKAKSEAKQLGRPILLLQTLGDIDGFA